MFEDRQGGELYIQAGEIYKTLSELLPLTDVDWIHCKYCFGSCGAIASNIAEGLGKNPDKNNYYKQGLRQARGYAHKTLAYIHLGVIAGVITEEVEEELGNALMALSDDLLLEIQ